jgi:hypothetical protein
MNKEQLEYGEKVLEKNRETAIKNLEVKIEELKKNNADKEVIEQHMKKLKRYRRPRLSLSERPYSLSRSNSLSRMNSIDSISTPNSARSFSDFSDNTPLSARSLNGDSSTGKSGVKTPLSARSVKLNDFKIKMCDSKVKTTDSKVKTPISARKNSAKSNSTPNTPRGKSLKRVDSMKSPSKKSNKSAIEVLHDSISGMLNRVPSTTISTTVHHNSDEDDDGYENPYLTRTNKELIKEATEITQKYENKSYINIDKDNTNVDKNDISSDKNILDENKNDSKLLSSDISSESDLEYKKESLLNESVHDIVDEILNQSDIELNKIKDEIIESNNDKTDVSDTKNEKISENKVEKIENITTEINSGLNESDIRVNPEYENFKRSLSGIKRIKYLDKEQHTEDDYTADIQPDIVDSILSEGEIVDDGMNEIKNDFINDETDEIKDEIINDTESTTNPEELTINDSRCESRYGNVSLVINKVDTTEVVHEEVPAYENEENTVDEVDTNEVDTNEVVPADENIIDAVDNDNAIVNTELITE